jgi:aspartate/methionine/tyrosine aminotransferase
VLLFCSPSNPTGSVYSPEQVRQIGQWAYQKGLWVITDEIYEHLLYDGAVAPSICVAVPELADQTIIINGVAKTYAMTGWRVGWMIGPKDLIKAATNLQSHLSSNVSNVSQRAAIAALSGDLSAVHKIVQLQLVPFMSIHQLRMYWVRKFGVSDLRVRQSLQH